MVVYLLDLVNSLRTGCISLRSYRNVELDIDTISVGNNAVVVRCYLDNDTTPMSLKCYLTPHHNVGFIYGEAYHQQEVEIYSINGQCHLIDALITPWVEGRSLDQLLGAADSDYPSLSRTFDRLAIDILRAPVAHGDIKPENIIVHHNATMELVDWDSAWNEEINDYGADECGTPAYRHPLRSKESYNKSIDDYPIALISTMLSTLAHDRATFEPLLTADKRLFTPRLILQGRDEVYTRALAMLDRCDAKHYNIAKLLSNTTPSLPRLPDYLLNSTKNDSTERRTATILQPSHRDKIGRQRLAYRRRPRLRQRHSLCNITRKQMCSPHLVGDMLMSIDMVRHTHKVD